MEAIALFFTKFSDELLGVQAALLCFSLSLALYWMLIRKKKRESAEWVPAALVKAYLDRVRSDEQDTRRRLFGEESFTYTASTSQPSITAQLNQAMQMPVSGGVGGVVDTKELDALRAQLSMADQRAMEFDRMLNVLRAEKSALEQKLREAAAVVPAATGGAALPAEIEAIKKAYADAQAKLDEYGLIEDELANLKKFQKENEQLRSKIAAMEGGGANLTVVPGGATAAVPSTTISGVTEKITTPMTVISGGAAPVVAAATAPVAPAPVLAEAPAPSPETNTNVLAPITPQVDVGSAAPVAAAAAPAAAPGAAPAADAGAADKTPKQKEEDLLSEFEKMLAS